MRSLWHAFTGRVRQILRVLVLFAIARAVFGVALILFFDREAVAWGYEATLVVVAAFVVYVAVGFAVRRRAT